MISGHRARLAFAGLVALLMALCGLGALTAASAWADSTVTVNTALDETAAGDGTCSLREALAYADGENGGDHDCGVTPSGTTTILVPAETSPFPLTRELVVNETGPGPVVIKGAGAGQTTISAEGHDRVLAIGKGANVTIEDVTITGGLTASGGGAILNGGTLVLQSVTVTGNATENATVAGSFAGAGGGILNYLGSLTVSNSTVSHNSTGSGGSGIGAASCALSPGGTGGAGGDGGAIYNNYGMVNVVNTTIEDNSTGDGGDGGAGSSCSAPSSVGSAGGTGGAGGRGAGIYSIGGTLTISGSTLTANAAGAGGNGGGGGSGDQSGGAGGAGGPGGSGGAIAADGALSMVNDTVLSDPAGVGGSGGTGGNPPFGAQGPGGPGGDGGGIAQLGGSASLTNLTISLNRAGTGGPGSPNGSLGGGDGIGVLVGGSLTEANTIVSEDNCAGPVTDGGFDLLWAGFGCPFAVFGNPDLQPLAENGGPTETMALGGVNNPAVDKGPAFPLVCPATDQRGDARPDFSEQACDIGAYEQQDVPTVPVCPTCHLFAGATLAPHFFGLNLHGTEKRGATVVSVLHKPRVLVLLVRKITSHHRLIMVGLVRLGHHPEGRSTTHWNLHVNGRLLPAGRYEVIMYALDNGDILSLTAHPGARTLTVLPNGRVRTQLSK